MCEIVRHSDMLHVELAVDTVLQHGKRRISAIGLSSDEIMSQMCTHSRDDQFFLNLVDLPDRSKLKGSYQGICW